MKWKEWMESGILEWYVLGRTDAAETREVEHMASLHPEVRAEIEAIGLTLERLALAGAVTPDPDIKPLLFATLRYMTRRENGEAPASPPMLHAGSKVSDYAEWLDRPDLQLNEPLEGLYAHIIGHVPGALTAIVWMKEGSPPEVHTDEFERFLVVDGTCEIHIDDKVYPLVPGNYMEIPLHRSHEVKITSDIPCRVILQRVAA